MSSNLIAGSIIVGLPITIIETISDHLFKEANEECQRKNSTGVSRT